MISNGDCTTPEAEFRSEAHYFRYTSIAHYPVIEQHGAYLAAPQTIGRDQYVGLYRGIPTRCENLGLFKVGKRNLVNVVTGKRFASVKGAIKYYREGGK